jgi:hypothetical protein
MKPRAESYEERLVVRGDEPVFNDDGVDLTQVRRALALSPLERLAMADQAALEIDALCRIARLKVNTGGKH